MKPLLRAGLRRRGPDALLAVSGLLVSLLLAVTAGRSQPGAAPMDIWAYLTVVACCGLLAVRRQFPLQVAAAAGAGLLFFAVRDYPGGPLVVPVVIAAYTVGTAVDRSRAMLAGGVAVAIVVARAWATAATHGHVSAFTWAAPGWVIASLVWGAAVRSRRAAMGAIRERAEAAERSREQEAARRVAEERVRIARELHDVIGHSFTVVNIQARMAAAALETAPEQSRRAMTDIETISRDALREIRQALSVLRGHEQPGQRVPPGTAAGGMDQLEKLFEAVRAAGPTVEVTMELAGRPIPLVVGTAIYRIVQESLTNVLRHASARRVTVRVARNDDAIRLEITDDGSGTAPLPGRAVTAAGTWAGPDGTTAAAETSRASHDRAPAANAGIAAAMATGRGIAGMTERALALGGQLEAGGLPGGGYRVTARLPVTG